ncbi:unnamed protein product [Allacma fusca]|uniref:Uncharacterized protein n=1 Tax=Allacma fusca TaxID=39272 RepID=A0A8J2PB70_9HEXA|nr:unnamed protein product [Allacma fusca]
MKVIILLAICFTAALAVPVTRTTARVNPLLEFTGRFQPRLKALNVPHLISKLLENPPGIKEVWEQFESSLYEISDIIDALPSQLVPFIRDNDLKVDLEEKLPSIAELAAQTAYKDTEDYIAFWKSYYEDYIGVPYPLETIIEDFIMVGSVFTAFDLPYVNIRETGKLINERNTEAGKEFEAIITNAVEGGIAAVDKFMTKVEEAYNGAAN